MLLTACSASDGATHPAGEAIAALTPAEAAKAAAVAREFVAQHGATLTRVSVVARPGTVQDFNTGFRCSSGRELQILLVGQFPDLATTGNPTKVGSRSPDVTARAMTITADAGTGRACLIGVQTTGIGKSEPLPGATTLAVE